jgi:spore coat polysaccharide biosynthesis protein SpsF
MIDKTSTIAIIQARMGSSRLPGKVLLDIVGQPMLRRVIERTRLAQTVGRVIVATTCDPSDDPVADFCEQRGVDCFRGSQFDVLDRYYQAARRFDAETIVRITADCPLIDPQVIDRTVRAFFGDTAPFDRLLSNGLPQSDSPNPKSQILNPKSFDFVANRLPLPYGRTFPIGLDTEVCTFTALQTAWEEASEKFQREHVMPFFYDHLERFQVLLVNHAKDLGTLRWTVDTPEDLELLRRIYANFPDRMDFSWLEVLELFERHPELAQINAGVQAKHYRQFDKRQS